MANGRPGIYRRTVLAGRVTLVTWQTSSFFWGCLSDFLRNLWIYDDLFLFEVSLLSFFGQTNKRKNTTAMREAMGLTCSCIYIYTHVYTSTIHVTSHTCLSTIHIRVLTFYRFLEPHLGYPDRKMIVGQPGLAIVGSFHSHGDTPIAGWLM